MRYKKTVKENNSVTATYDYVYSDGTLILITYTKFSKTNDDVITSTSTTARFIYDSFGEPRGFILNNSALYLYLKNAQGDITGVVDEYGEIIVSYTYDAWGNVSFTQTNMANAYLSATLSNINPFTYRGYCYDYDIGMYYLQSRYYDPQICRFINADSTDYLGATGTLLSYNLFAYCENDAVDFVDETGYCWLTSKGKVCHDNWEFPQKYDRNDAVSYAKKYYRIYNTRYCYYGEDCTNFVSQCLFAGGILMSNKWHCFGSKEKKGLKEKYGWDLETCRNGKYWNVSDAWRLAKDCYNYFKNSSFIRRTVKINKNTKIKDVISKYNIQKGDILFFDKGDGKGVHHAAIISKIEKNNIYYTAHSRSRLNKNIKDYFEDNKRTITVLVMK